ncbi:MAG: S8 family serine peptidase [Acidobacteria bacterium]|nr:S8 family serine peptidase [Acidobacteriota bacterium]
MGLAVEHDLMGGSVVNLEGRNHIKDLESSGFRVKLLPDTNILNIGNYQIDTEATSQTEDEEAAGPPVPRELDVPATSAREWRHHLVQLAAPPTEEWIRQIEERGVRVVEPVSSYGLFVAGSPEAVETLRGLDFVTWVGPLKPAYRIAPNLVDKTGRIRYVNVGVYPAEAAGRVREQIGRLEGEVVNGWTEGESHRPGYCSLIAEIDSRNLNEVARIPEVRWLEYQSPGLSTDDERSCQIVAENLDGVASPDTGPLLGYADSLNRLGLGGDGVVVGICDTGLAKADDGTLHPDLRGRLAFFVDVTAGVTPTDVNGHGTHVTGIAVGDAATGATDPDRFLLGQGVAPRARFGVINPVDTNGGPGTDPLAAFTREMVAHGAHVMNNSWHQNGGSGYTANAAVLDKLVRDPNGDNHADPERSYLVIVFSAGNDGKAGLPPPKEAKNAITVGNSINFRPKEGPLSDIRGISPGSSRGPASDQRILPNVVAPGTRIVSARSRVETQPGQGPRRKAYVDAGGTRHDDYTIMSGTSQAAPHVSGLCALLIEWWRSNHGGQNPSPAMLKALLINGAEDIAGGPNGFGGQLRHIPNNDQGWGRVSLENVVLDAPDSDRGPKILSDQERVFTSAGQEFLISVTAKDEARPLRVTLVWTDAPGSPDTTPALRNDLDLEVAETESGAVFKGNVFDAGFSVAGGQFDALNNVECVYVKEPRGSYDVRVIASALRANARPPFDNDPWQDFALVIDNAERVEG